MTNRASFSREMAGVDKPDIPLPFSDNQSLLFTEIHF